MANHISEEFREQFRRHGTSKNCTREGCNGLAYLDRYCGAYVCDECAQHLGLARCFCGWSLSGGDGRRELEEMGEQIDDDY